MRTFHEGGEGGESRCRFVFGACRSHADGMGGETVCVVWVLIFGFVESKEKLVFIAVRVLFRRFIYPLFDCLDFELL